MVSNIVFSHNASHTISTTNMAQNVAQTGLIKHGEINAELYSHWFTYSSKICHGRKGAQIFGRFRVVPKLVASDRKIGRSWMLAYIK